MFSLWGNIIHSPPIQDLQLNKKFERRANKAHYDTSATLVSWVGNIKINIQGYISAKRNKITGESNL